MKDYTIYCNKEQTEIAYKLGAPIESKTKVGYYGGEEYPVKLNVFQYGKIPTAEQMCGWLREKQGILIHVESGSRGYYGYCMTMTETGYDDITVDAVYDSYEEALLAAISDSINWLNNYND